MLMILLLFIMFCGVDVHTLDFDPPSTKKCPAKGKCVLIAECPSAVEEFLNQRLPLICGYVGSLPLVCCSEKSFLVKINTENPITTHSTIQTYKSKATSKSPMITTTTESFASALETKAKRKCMEYSKHVFKNMFPPILLPKTDLYSANECGFKEVELIIGGKPAKPKEFPHMALIGYTVNGTTQWNCGGTLISEQFVLTAAHCCFQADYGYAKFVRLGDINYKNKKDDANVQDFTVAEIKQHPLYNPKSKYHDIALFKFDRPAQFNQFVRPACLHTPTDIPTNRAMATGWGLTEDNVRSKILLKVTLDLFPHDRCNKSFKSHIDSRLKIGIIDDIQVCAGSFTKRDDTCLGDSGGPLQIYNKDNYCMYEIIGVTSFGRICGIINSPAIYTRVSYYVDWIESIIWPS